MSDIFNTLNVASMITTAQKVAKDPRPYVVASAPVCLVVGAPLAMSGAFMLVCFGFSFFSLVFATAFSAFFLMAALVLLTLGLLPLAVTAWAFKPKEFKHYSHAGLTACATCLERGSNFVDPGSDAPKIAIYQKVHQARGLLCTLLAKGSSLFSVVDSKIQQTEI